MSEQDNTLKKTDNVKQDRRPSSRQVFSYAKGMAIASHIFGYIIGPLIILGGIGYLLDKWLKTYPFITIGALIVAMIMSNVFIIKRTTSLFSNYLPKPPEKEKKDK